MRTYDALVVGGGPAGSTCARALGRAGWNVLVVDRAEFPRDKVCAGWISPEVFELLDLTPADYANAGLTLQSITSFRTALLGGRVHDVNYGRAVGYAIRRAEFDAFLMSRADVQCVDRTPVVTLRRADDLWIVNEALRTPVLVGAGGHFCPVARHVRGGRDREPPVVAKEVEVRRDGRVSQSDAPSLFFCRDLDGYGWSLPKGDFLNVGLGHRDHHAFAARFDEFVHFLEASNTVPRAASLPWHGHAYLACGAGARPLVGDGVLLVGDAAGVAYPSSGEGIRPGIESALLAARTLIAAAGRHDRDALRPYAEALTRKYPHETASRGIARAMQQTIGRALLRSSTLTQRVVLDQWFVRPSPVAGASPLLRPL